MVQLNDILFNPDGIILETLLTADEIVAIGFIKNPRAQEQALQRIVAESMREGYLPPVSDADLYR